MSRQNILLNYYNFDGDWARCHLKKLFANKPRVLILPLAYRPTQAWDNESWLNIYGKDGEKYAAIIKPFAGYGYKEGETDWLNPYDERDHLSQIRRAEMLFFTGGMPERALKRLDDLGLTDAVKNFDGIVAGASAGAMLQLKTYHITPDEDYPEYAIDNGLGLVEGLDLEVHYLATPLQDECAERAHREHGLPVYKMRHEGGLLINGGNITVMGDVTVCK